MAIKYVCDFCGQEAKNFHKEFSSGEIVCDNCYDHLKKQTWRLAEEPAELEKAKNIIRQESQKLDAKREELAKEQAMDCRMAVRYQNGFHAVIRLYNEMVKVLDDALPKGFLFSRRASLRTIPETEINNLEERAIGDVVRQVERNFHDNFDDYLERDPLYNREALCLNNLPTVHLPWNKDN